MTWKSGQTALFRDGKVQVSYSRDSPRLSGGFSLRERLHCSFVFSSSYSGPFQPLKVFSDFQQSWLCSSDDGVPRWLHTPSCFASFHAG